MARILASSFRVRSAAPPPPSGPVYWPRYLPGPNGTRRTVMMRIPPEQIPAGWQSVRITVPMRLASCEEVDCPFFLRGWSEVVVPDGSRHTANAEMTADKAAATFGLYGPQELAPVVIHHEAGTPCPGDASKQPPIALVNAGEALLSERAHRLPTGVPPLYSVNGRTVMWNEFEDCLAGGLHRAAEIAG